MAAKPGKQCSRIHAYLRRMRIFLIGYMASGKSAVGRLLAEQLRVPFIDLDEWIESNAGMRIPEIFSTQGEAVFRRMESDGLLDLIAHQANAVIATGGGTPCFENNLEAMLNNGKVIYLRSDAETLAQRIKADASHRPLTLTEDFNVSEHLASRLPFYERAHRVVDASQNLRAVVEAIGLGV